jgi:5-methylcytosine-specific restriction endonuclease McrA
MPLKDPIARAEFNKNYKKEWTQRPEVKDRLRILNRQWGRNHKEERVESVIRSRKKTGYKRPAVLRRAEWLLRRTRLRGAAGSFTREQWLARLEYYGNSCGYCWKPLTEETAQIDHIKAVSVGGSNWPSNLAPACPRCNMRKGARRWIPRRKASGQSTPRLTVKES